MRETPKTLTTTLIRKLIRGTRLIVEPNGKNVRNWTIRIQASLCIGWKVQRLNGCG